MSGDADRLAQVLINLLDNALRVTSTGGKIIITALEEPAVISISISDTGHGIAEEKIPLIWERFYFHRIAL